MLKTRVGDDIWLVHQPDHARVAGYLAAHWGGTSDFARPGHYAPTGHPERLRQEVVQAIAEHDNGWWEWEASPAIDPEDGLPLGLSQVGQHHSGEGLERWRHGVPRLAETHPYVALLISLHAYWLYAFAFDDLPGRDDAFRHPLFGDSEQVKHIVSDPERTRRFLEEQGSVQQLLLERLRGDGDWAETTDPSHLYPHFKLLQVMDALSLLLAFGGAEARELADVPGLHWHDRRTIRWRPESDRRIVCDPFPFDTEPLLVHLPVRIVPGELATLPKVESMPLTRLHAIPLRTVQFELAHRSGLETVH